MNKAIRSTAADRAVDFARAADAFSKAATELRVALGLTSHHGARISYGEAVAESIEEWARDARKQYETSLRRARGQHKEQVDKHADESATHKYMYADGTTGNEFRP